MTATSSVFHSAQTTRTCDAMIAASEASAPVHYWPAELLEAFTFRMSAQGMSVMASMMLGDRRYALLQLARAHGTNDDGLHLLADELFRFFEQHQSGLPRIN